MGLSIVERDAGEIGIDLSAVAELVTQLGPLAVVDLETPELVDTLLALDRCAGPGSAP